MAESIKFTEAELNEITELRNANAQKINEFGQIELEILLTNQRLDVLVDTKQNLEKQYIELQTKEKDLVTKLNEKYGTGTVDLESGEFVPRSW